MTVFEATRQYQDTLEAWRRLNHTGLSSLDAEIWEAAEAVARAYDVMFTAWVEQL